MGSDIRATLSVILANHFISQSHSILICSMVLTLLKMLGGVNESLYKKLLAHWSVMQ